MSEQKTIAIIGGGLSGLSAAYHLRQLRPLARIMMFESNAYLGGVLKTENVGGYLIENSADMFTVEPNDALNLCQRLGHADKLLATRSVPQRAFIATADGIKPVPQGFSLMLPNDPQAVAQSGLLDETGVARFYQERNVPPRTESSDESLESFAVRRFGSQVFERMIQPLVSGIYTADPKQLSMQATLSRFVLMEQKYGSLLAAAESRKQELVAADRENAAGSSLGYEQNQLTFADQTASGARYDLFRAPQLGMNQLVGWIVDELGTVEIKTNVKILQIEKQESGWRLDVETPCAGMPPQFDGVIVTTPARLAAPMLRDMDTILADQLEAITAASCAVVVLGLDERQLGNSFSGFGIVVPSSLNRKLIAVSFSSNKFAGRAPTGRVLLRAFVGGALHRERVDLCDDELLALTLEELDRWLQIQGTPELAKVYRWRDRMPQYHVGHLGAVARIRAGIERHPGLELAGNSYNGVGIPVCLAGGKTAAERMNQFLKQT